MKKLTQLIREHKGGKQSLRHDIYLGSGNQMRLYLGKGRELPNFCPVLRNLQKGRIYVTDEDFEEHYGGEE